MSKKNKLNKKKGKPTPVNFQDTILNLQKFWGKYGCVILQPYDVEVGAGTFHPATTLRSLGPESWKAAYVQPSRRPTDGRYGKNPNRLQHYYQFQVIIKPSPDEIKKVFLRSLSTIGINYKDDPKKTIQWLKDMGNPYSNIPIDRHGKIAIDWGVYGIPETFIVNSKGVIKYRHIGPVTKKIYGKLSQLIKEVK